jgi:hypothetical protein
MQHLRVFVEIAADAMAAEFAHHGESRCLRRASGLPRRLSPRWTPGLYLGDADPHAFMGHLDTRRLARIEVSPTQNMRLVSPCQAVLDDRDVEVDDVALLQRPVVGYAMADLVIDRGADRLGVGRVAGGRVVERRGIQPCTLTM